MQNLITLRRRQREADTIWRGQQYERAIRLYYHKTGKYPQSLDDLQKGLPELHFLRSCAYKDPINTTDGSWRFIYVNGTGAIIGSVRYASLQQMALIDLNGGKLPGAQLGTPAADLASGSNSDDANAAANSSPQAPQSGDTCRPPASPANPLLRPAPSRLPVAGGATPGAPGAASTGTGPNGAVWSGSGHQSAPSAQAHRAGRRAGARWFITGVASKVDQPSIRVYNGGKKYINWEFIWNPLEEQARAVQNGLSQAKDPSSSSLASLACRSARLMEPRPGSPRADRRAQQAPPQQAPPRPTIPIRAFTGQSFRHATNPEPESDTTPRRGLHYYKIGSAIVLALSICYVGLIFFSRWQQNRAVAERAEKAAAAKRTQDRADFSSHGRQQL